MDIKDFKARIKSGDLAGWYIFSGEEDYLKKYYMNELRSLVSGDEAFAPFNYLSFSDAEIDFGAVAEAIKSPPMMSEYKLIEWKFAPLDSLKEGEKEALFSLFDLREEYPYAIFSVMTTEDGFDVGTEKRPSKLAAKLKEGFEIINFPKSTDQQLLSWLKRHFDSEGVAVDAPTLNALLFRVGRSMEVLNNEVLKLCYFAKANGLSSVNAEAVEWVSSSTAECDAFALSNAVLDKNIDGALTALADLKQRRVEPQVIIGMLERVYSELSSVAFLLDEGRGAADIESLLKFHPFKTKLYMNSAKKAGSKGLLLSLDALCKMDASSKSGGISGYGAIESFIMQNF